jgi:hypothetical protein
LNLNGGVVPKLNWCFGHGLLCLAQFLSQCFEIWLWFLLQAERAEKSRYLAGTLVLINHFFFAKLL